MYNTKIPKTQQVPKGPLVQYKPINTTFPDITILNTLPYIQFFSVDPGTKNYAVRIERRYNDGKIETRVMELVDLMQEDESHDIATNSTYFNLIQLFNSMWSEIRLCHVFIVERQIPPNYKAIRIQTTTMDYLMMHWGQYAFSYPFIFDVEASFKNRSFGMKKIMGSVKIWSIKMALHLLKYRQDEVGLSKFVKPNKLEEFYHHPLNFEDLTSSLPPRLKVVGKLDDLADTVVQIEAVCQKFSIGVFTVQTIHNTPLVLIMNTETTNTNCLQLNLGQSIIDTNPVQVASSSSQMQINQNHQILTFI